MSSASDRVRRAAASLALLIVLVVPFRTAAAQPPPRPPPGDPPAAPAELPADWTRIVPSGVRLYVEFRDLSVMRHRLRRVGIWDTIRALGEPPSDVPLARRPWQQRTEQLLGMSAEEAVIKVLGLRTALVAADPYHWEAGLVLAQVGDAAMVPRFLAAWNAEPRGAVGAARLYGLSGGLQLAVRDRTLLFGPQRDDEALFTRTTLLLAGQAGAPLADDPAFVRLRRDLPAQFDGLAYFAGPERNGPTAPEPRTAPGLRASPSERKAASDALLAVLTVRAEDVRIEVRSGAAGRDFSPHSPPFAGPLPPGVVAAWGGTFDAGSFRARTGAAPSGLFSLRTIAEMLLSEASGPDHPPGLLGPRAALLLSRAPREPARGFETPGLVFLLETARPDDALNLADAGADLLRGWCSIVAGESEPLPLSRYRLRGTPPVEARRISLGAALSRRTRCPLFADLDLHWAAIDSWLAVSTTRSGLEDVAAVLQGGSARLDRNGAPPEIAVAARGPRRDWMLVRGAALAEVLQSWLDYLDRIDSPIRSRDYWRQWARRRGEERRRLGVSVRPAEPPAAAARVVEVSVDSPAWALIAPGDLVVAADGHPLSGKQPADDLARRFRGRSDPGRFVLTVRRDDESLDVAIPLKVAAAPPADLDPFAALRTLVELARRIDSLTIVRTVEGPQLRTSIAVRWVNAGGGSR